MYNYCQLTPTAVDSSLDVSTDLSLSLSVVIIGILDLVLLLPDDTCSALDCINLPIDSYNSLLIVSTRVILGPALLRFSAVSDRSSLLRIDSFESELFLDGDTFVLRLLSCKNKIIVNEY